MSRAPTALLRAGEKAFERMDKISAEFFAITYGALVRQMMIDYAANADAVNTQLEEMGVRIGMRLIEEFVARSEVRACRSFNATGEAIAKVGLKMFLGISAQVEAVADESYSLVFEDNPLTLFVELPDNYRAKLWYSNILCGVIRGALDQVSIKTECTYVRDVLRGDDTNEIRVRFKGIVPEQFKTKDE